MTDIAIDAEAQQAVDGLWQTLVSLSDPGARQGEGNIAAYHRQAERQLAELREALGRLELDRAVLRRALDTAGHPYHVVEREPLLHSHITDLLPEDHPLAYECVSCQRCRVMVHASNNECMTMWVETGLGNFCLACFVAVEEATNDIASLALKR